MTGCKDGHLARVAETLDLAPYNQSLATLILAVPDAETRKLLAEIADTATNARKAELQN